MNFRKPIILVAASALTVVTMTGVQTLAWADAVSAEARLTVRFDDLNLSSTSGVRALYARIQGAAREVCGPSQAPDRRGISPAWTDCVSAAVRRAVLDVDRPGLTAYYAEQLRRPWPRAAG